MTDQEKPKVEFPCQYPIKIMGPLTDDYQQAVLEIIKKHDPDFNPETATTRPSKNANYLAVNVIITATGKPQIQAIFDDLKDSGRISMVL